MASVFLIRALKRSIERGQRYEEQLRQQLATQRDEYAMRAAHCDAQRERVENERNTLDRYIRKIDALASGGQAFSPELFNDYHTYVNTLTERVDMQCQELQRLEALLSEAAETVTQTFREIARNTGRIDRCRDRLQTMKRTLEMASDDAIDEEAEELSVARSLRRKALR
ncbi:hypothetical protein [Burkholderia sp. TSV86]|uniref:hypothetical protein n=1 Tax=Burkholderia sp. TSV86 TaxID=1385594 RepID=UPI00075A8938|nr:hypothetical protein [Burkholderia sp. TSV86]KVE37986.1 hypothetical protein WS68_24865 [Burkholderia sp. TSV86]